MSFFQKGNHEIDLVKMIDSTQLKMAPFKDASETTHRVLTFNVSSPKPFSLQEPESTVTFTGSKDTRLSVSFTTFKHLLATIDFSLSHICHTTVTTTLEMIGIDRDVSCVICCVDVIERRWRQWRSTGSSLSLSFLNKCLMVIVFKLALRVHVTSHLLTFHLPSVMGGRESEVEVKRNRNRLMGHLGVDHHKARRAKSA